MTYVNMQCCWFYVPRESYRILGGNFVSPSRLTEDMNNLKNVSKSNNRLSCSWNQGKLERSEQTNKQLGNNWGTTGEQLGNKHGYTLTVPQVQTD